MNEHEEQTIAAFVVKEKQDRYRFLLGNPDARKRAKGLDRLNHNREDFDPKYLTLLPGGADAARLLRREGSPEEVYVVSCTDAIDGRVLPLEEAVREAEDGGWGTLISCIPGRLAYYYGEEGETRALLKRKP